MKEIIFLAAVAVCALMAGTALAASTGTTTWHVGYYNNNQASNTKASSGGVASLNFTSAPNTALLTTNQKSLTGDLAGKTITATYMISGVTGLFTYYNQATSQCSTPPMVRLYFETSKAGGFNPTQYWWSNPISAVLKNTTGTVTLTTTVTPGLVRSASADVTFRTDRKPSHVDLIDRRECGIVQARWRRVVPRIVLRALVPRLGPCWKGEVMATKKGLTVALVVATAVALGSPAGSGAMLTAGSVSKHAISKQALVFHRSGRPSSTRGTNRLTRGAAVLLARAVAQSQTAGTGTRFICFPAASATNTSTTQTCVINGSTGVCVERSSNPGVTQTCTFNQTNTNRSNIAIAVQVIEQRNAAQAGTTSQAGTQVVTTSQGNGSGSNFNWTTQIVKQFLGAGSSNPDDEESRQQQVEAHAQAQGMPAQFGSLFQSLEGTEVAQENATPSLSSPVLQPVTQTQASQQTISVCQGSTTDCHSSTGMTGTNVNGSYQSLRQWEWANNAPSIDQSQNPSGGNCSDSSSSSLNMCSVVSQKTTGGKNLSGVWELYRQFQRALHTADGSQVQDGPGVGGLGHDVFQTSDGLLTGPQRDWIVTGQRARQVQRADDAGTLTQIQDPHADKGPGSFQFGTAADTWTGVLTADQQQLMNGAFSTVGTQQQTLTYEGDSSGEIVASVRGTQNGSSASANCAPGDGSPHSCHAGVECFSGSEGGGCSPFTPNSEAATRKP